MTSKIIVISTRPPVAPLSGGMAPAVKNACSAFDDVTWYAICNRDGIKSNFGQSATHQKIPDVIEDIVAGMQVKQIVVDGEKWDDHYNKASNSIIWPMCHDRFDIAAPFGAKEYYGTLNVNELMAEIIVRDLGDDKATPIWVHDYHHLSIPMFLRKLGVENPIVFFNHTPLPDPKKIAQLSDADRGNFVNILKGLHYCDAANFQTAETARRFMDLTDLPVTDLGAFETVPVPVSDNDRERTLLIGHYPISVPTAKIIENAVATKPLSEKAQALADKLVARHILINFERCDYSKGILPRLRAFEKLLDNHPEYSGHVQLVIGAEPTRGDIQDYKIYAMQVRELIKNINDKWPHDDGHNPVVLLPDHIPNEDIVRLMRNDKPGQRKIGTVTPYRDGMNLVAKEFAAAQDLDNAGVLILSSGAGAAAEMDLAGQGAIIYNPDGGNALLPPDQKCDPIYEAMLKALVMPQDEANERARLMQEQLKAYDIAAWGAAHKRLIDVIRGEPEQAFGHKTAAPAPAPAPL